MELIDFLQVLTEQKQVRILVNLLKLTSIKCPHQKRLQRIESSRQLDLFSELSLGLTEDEAEEEANVVSEGIGQYMPLLQPSGSGEKSANNSVR